MGASYFATGPVTIGIRTHGQEHANLCLGTARSTSIWRIMFCVSFRDSRIEQITINLALLSVFILFLFDLAKSVG